MGKYDYALRILEGALETEIYGIESIELAIDLLRENNIDEQVN